MSSSNFHENPTRREFLKRSAAGLLTTGVVGSVAVSANLRTVTVNSSDLPIVDTHQHLWDLERFTLPWLGGAPEVLKRSYVTKDFLAATNGLNVVKTVYMEVNVADHEKSKEADYVIELCGRDDDPMAAAVIGGVPHTVEFADYAKKYAKNKFVRGVRNVLHDPDRPRGMCLESTFVANMRLLGELGLSFDLCMRPGEISDGAALAKQCPGTRFIIDHCGNMPVKTDDNNLRPKWIEGMKAGAQLDNVVCKISGIVVTAEKDNWTAETLAANVNFCLDTFGEDRVFFGGDWPVCLLSASYAQWVTALKAIVANRSLEFQKKLFHDNATRLYRL